MASSDVSQQNATSCRPPVGTGSGLRPAPNPPTMSGPPRVNAVDSVNHSQHNSVNHADDSPPGSTESPSWRRARDKRLGGRQTTPSCNPAVNSKMKVRDRRKLREKRRSPGAAFMPSTEETTSGEDDDKGFNGDTLTKETWQAPLAEGGARQNSVERAPPSANHPPIGKRLSPAVANFMCRFRGSKSQSDLDADCEDNTADYDSASMMSASEALAPNSSQFFVPAQSGEGDFRSHVQEIRVAGMQQLGQSGGQATDDDPLSGSSSSSGGQEDLAPLPDGPKKHAKTFLLQQIGQQEARISHLERAVDDLSKQLYDAHRQNHTLRSENEALASKCKLERR